MKLLNYSHCFGLSTFSRYNCKYVGYINIFWFTQPIRKYEYRLSVAGVLHKNEQGFKMQVYVLR